MNIRSFQKSMAYAFWVALLLSGLLAQFWAHPVQAAAKADLVITQIEVLPDPDRVTNEDTIIRVTITNTGAAAAGSFYIDTYIGWTPDSCSDIGDYYDLIDGVAVGEEVVYSLKIQIEDINDLDGLGRPWSGPGTKDITVVLDLCNNVGEEDETNNTNSVTVTINEPPVVPPINDEFNDAIEITNLPFNSTMDVRGATLNIGTDKHVSQCELYRGAKSVWYQFQPSSNTSVIFDTFTSDYDTYIAVWTGTVDNLTEVACNDDARSTKQSRVGVHMIAGTTYYIQIAEYRFNTSPSASALTLPAMATTRPASDAESLNIKPQQEVSPLATFGYLNLHAYIDNIPPEVTSITYGDPSATKDASVRFTVQFSEDVENLDENDFALVKTGSISGESITSVIGINDTYTVTVNTGSGSGTLKLVVPNTATIEDIVGNVMTALPYNDGVTYKVRIQTFADVPLAYSSWQFIEQLYAAGITGGCGTAPLVYCPTTTVTRDQMAVFLLRGIHGATYTPPAVGSSTGFVDVPTTHWAASWIKQLAAEGITGGCGGGNYCPSSPVTRDQMAVFLLRTKYGASYTPPPVGSSSGFADVPTTYWAAPWIKQLAAEGITGGCGGGNYCPSSPVTRDQMSIFLVRTFNLP